MSPGKERANQDGSRAHASKEAGEGDRLPIRLSVTRGALGIELSDETTWGRARVRELSLELLGVSFPVDLSRGVKQFLSHRTQFDAATLDLDLPDLARRWADSLTEFLGEASTVRLLPLVSAGEESSESVIAANEAAGRFEGLEVTITSPRACLVFELLVIGGPEVLVVIDAARCTGDHPLLSKQSAMVSALGSLDVGLRALSSLGLHLGRSGRVISASRVPLALCLAVLPDFGLRLPRMEGPMLADIEHCEGTLRVQLGRAVEPLSGSTRALGLLSMAGTLSRADEANWQGDRETARDELLSTLETVSHHPLSLLELAELDLLEPDRGEAALSFLEEVHQELSGPCVGQRSRHALLLSRALIRTGRPEAARETLARALSLETNARFFGRLTLESLSGLSGEAALVALGRAVERAPSDARLRRERLPRLLAAHRLEEASADAEHLLAQAPNPSARASVCLEAARHFDDAQVESEAISWLRRCLRFVPEQPEALMRLARAMRAAAQPARALQLAHAAVRALEGGLPGQERGLAEARLLLARLHFETNRASAAGLVQLGMIDSRGKFGGLARLLEATEYQGRGDTDHRDRSLLRLAEAIDLGWVEVGDVAAELRHWCDEVSPPPPPRLRVVLDRFFARREPSSKDESSSRNEPSP